jgi:hypothetical protein
MDVYGSRTVVRQKFSERSQTKSNVNIILTNPVLQAHLSLENWVSQRSSALS